MAAIFKELDLRATGFREVPRQATVISGCLALQNGRYKKQTSKYERNQVPVFVGKEAGSVIM